jgi:3-oxoadipate enol-lactonase
VADKPDAGREPGLYYTERGSGPPLLLIHGLMASGDMFEPVIDAFAAHRRVIVPDLRGHARSRRLGPPYLVRQLAADLSALLERLGVGSADGLGYSQGGAIAQQLALDDPGRCRRLVLACTYAYNMSTPREWLEGHLAPWLVALLGPRGMTSLAMRVGAAELDPAEVSWLVRVFADQDRKQLVAAGGRRWPSIAARGWRRSCARRSSSPVPTTADASRADAARRHPRLAARHRRVCSPHRHLDAHG